MVAEDRISEKTQTRALLIFNPVAGRPDLAPIQLVEILQAIQEKNMLPEVHLVTPESRLDMVVRDAIERGVKTILVCGGDGTIDNVAGGMIDTDATLCIIPGGTQNNIARSMGIPLGNIPAAIDILTNGRRIKVDVGRVICGLAERWFLEITTVGLLSALFPSADDIQHGNIARIGDFLATLVASAPSHLLINIDRGKEILEVDGHVLLAANMPFLGMQFKVAPDVSFEDGYLNLVVYSNLTKIDLLGVAVQITGGVPSDPRIQHYLVRHLTVQADPVMPVMADGTLLGDSPAEISVFQQRLAVMANPQIAVKQEEILIREEMNGRR
jgi:YegS/Rv2252/BmrU family lipid kinase